VRVVVLPLRAGHKEVRECYRKGFFFFLLSQYRLRYCRAGKAWKKLAGRHAKLAVRRTEKIWMERHVNLGTYSVLDLPNEYRKSSLLH
jgi:hypothetical protein